MNNSYRILEDNIYFTLDSEVYETTIYNERLEEWTEIIDGMTIYKDTELKAYLEQTGFHEVQIHKKKSWLCITARK